MKQYNKLVGYMACALLALGVTACEQEGDELSTPMTTGEKISFSAEIDDNAGRTMLADDGYTVTWKGDEEIGVFYTTTPTGGSNTTHRRNAKYTLSAGAGTASATLTGDIEWVDIVEGAHKFQMYYPYNADVTSSSAGYGTLPAEQEYDPTGWDISDYAFMVSGTASSETLGDNPTVTFKHLFSVLRFHVVNATDKDLTIEKLTVTSTNGLILAGDFQANVGKSKTYEALRNTTTEGETTNGYFKAAASSITTTLPEDTVVKAGEEMDIRVMINAGFKDGSTTEYYLEGETLAVDLYTTGNPVWSTEFTAGKLDRGARATKKLTVDAFDNSALTVSKITPDHDAESTKFYLNTVATATGLNLGAIEKVTVDGKEVSATGLQVSDNQIIFKIPDTIEKTTATSCKVVGYDSADAAYDLGSIMVYPFFYYKDVQLGLGSDSNKTYAEYASQNAFFVPDLGKVISAKEWYDTPIDGYAVAADKQAIAGEVATNTAVTNSAISSKNALNKDNVTAAAQYYANMPYLEILAFNNGIPFFAGPANSNSVLRAHFIDNSGWKNLLSYKIYGTPIIGYALASEASANAVKEGTLETMIYADQTIPNNSTAEMYGTSTATLQWKQGDVLVMGYASYERGNKISKLNHCAKLGFIHIKEVTFADLTTGLTPASPALREGYIKFDFYWSKPINDTADQPIYGDDGVALPAAPTPTPPADDELRAAGTFTVASAAEFSALKPLVDGDEIIWKNGTYNDINLTLDSDQAIAQGITFRAETNGGVLFTGNSTLTIKTNHTTVRGFHWKDPLLTDAEHLVRFQTGTSYGTLEQCAITGSNTTANYNRSCKWVSLSGDHHTVQYCSFQDKRDRGALLVVWFDEGVTPNHTIQYNHFTRPTVLIDPSDDDPANEQETIRVGDSANSLRDGKVTVKNNYFYRCWGESAEVVSNKSCANTYANNYFQECKGTLTLRHGNNCTVEGNYFYGFDGEGLVPESGGVRVIGEDHTVRGNHFEKLAGVGYKAALSLVRGQENAALSGYAQVKNALIENNIFNECVLAVHANYGGSNMTMPVISTTMRGNTIVSTNDSNYAVRYESTTPEAEITWENNTIYGKFKPANCFGLSAVGTKPTLADVSSARQAIANAAGVSWVLE